MHRFMYILNNGSSKLMHHKILTEIKNLDKKDLKISYNLYIMLHLCSVL